MDTWLRNANNHVRQFAARNHLRLRLVEDGEVRVLLGPRKTENCASYLGHKTWEVFFQAPSPQRVLDGVKDVATRLVCLDGEGFYEVPEAKLLKACARNRWTKPRQPRRGVERDRNASLRDVLVQSLDSD